MTKAEFIVGLPKLEKLFVMYSGVTHVPYVSCNEETANDEVIIFLKESDAVKFATENREQNQILMTALTYPKELILKFFSELYVYGINGMEFHTPEGETFNIELTEILKRNIPENLSEQEKPLENPQLQISMLYYMQEVRRPKQKLTREQLKDMDEEMVVNMTRATYFLPFQEKEVDGKLLPGNVVMKLKNDTLWMPIFTDVVEYTHFKGTSDQKLKLSKLKLQNLAGMKLPPEVKGFLINPSGVCVPVPGDFLQKIAGTVSV